MLPDLLNIRCFSPQVCLLDLDYNLPVQVRDYALGLDNEDEPSSGVGKEYQLQRKVDEGSLDSSFAQQRPTDLLLKLQRNTPYYKVWNGEGWDSGLYLLLVERRYL